MVSEKNRPFRGDALRWKSFARRLATSCIVCALAVPTLNVAIDPYGVFGTNVLRASSTSNERVTKARVLLKREIAAEPMILGSSVTGVIKPQALGPLAYNGSFFSATPGDVFRFLVMLERNGRLPRRVFVGLDAFMFTSPAAGAVQMRLPPAASGESRWEFWRDFLFAPSFSAIPAKLFEAVQNEPGVLFDEVDGSYRLPRLDSERSADLAGYARRRVSGARIPVTLHWWHEPAADDLVKLVTWAQSMTTTHITFFVPPMLPRMRLALGADGDRFFATTSRVVGETLIDLSELEELDSDRDFYDTKHFTPEAGDLVAQRLLRADAGSERQSDRIGSRPDRSKGQLVVESRR